ncbi:MAG: NAD(P)/FAD-dependent oxidoreductase, partial [Bacteroidota bacterium]
MKSGKSYKNYKGEREFDAIVIGSGMGGMTTGALLARRGKRVLVLERHYTAGGFTHVFKRRDYEWDVGIHYLGEVGWERSDGAKIFRYISDDQMEWADMGEEYDRIVFPDRAYGFVKGPQNFAANLKKWFPEEAEAIDQYMVLIRKVTGAASKLFFAERAIPGMFSSLVGGMMRKKMLRYARRTTAEVLDEITQNERLKAVLCGQYGDYGLPPKQSSFAIHCMVATHYLYGAAYPVGGSERIAETVLPVIEAGGGTTLVRAEVDEIIVEKGKAVGVRMADGGEFRSKLVISNAGYFNTVERLVPKAERKRFPSMESQGLTPSIGHFCLYLGLKHTAEELDLKSTNLWIYPSYDHDQNVADFLE